MKIHSKHPPADAAGPIRLLAVEDDPSLAFVLEEALAHTREAEIDATMASSLAEAFEHLAGKKRFELVLLDLSLPDSDGLETLTRMQSRAPGLPVVVLTGNDDPELAQRIAEAGVSHFLLKGEVGSKGLVDTIRAATAGPRQRAEVARAAEVAKTA